MFPLVTWAFPPSPTSEIFLPTSARASNETKAGIFPGKVIIVDHGKLTRTFTLGELAYKSIN